MFVVLKQIIDNIYIKFKQNSIVIACVYSVGTAKGE